MTQKNNLQTSEGLRKTLATFLRIARTHRSDIDMLPALEDLQRFVNQEVQKALSRVEVPQKYNPAGYLDPSLPAQLAYDEAINQITTSINKVKEQYKV